MDIIKKSNSWNCRNIAVLSCTSLVKQIDGVIILIINVHYTVVF